jgi:RNA polymerase sigma factor (sigma-70 family)
MQDLEDKIKETIERYSGLVRQVIWRQLHKNDSLYLEDVEQEVKLKIWDFLRKGKSIHNLSSYIKKVAYSTTVDELRKMRKQAPPRESGELQQVYVSTELLEAHRSGLSPESSLEEKEQKAFIHQSLGRLGKNRKQVLRLYLDGFSVDEIGEYFGWDNVKVRHLLYRGIDDLRDLIRSEKNR